MDEAGPKIRIAEHIEIAWLAGRTASALCPNCDTHGIVAQALDIDYRPPDAVHRFILQLCPHCGARFMDNTHTMDYGAQALIEIGWNIYQVQLGAGLWPISAPLTRVEKPAGARVLEIGGAYGFGLDFCIRARGWQGQGFDPSPLADFGARELGLDIAQDFFEAKDLAAGPWDVAIATEVIEHLAHPPAFFRLMRQTLAEDGMLVLTTPDAEWITPELSPAAMMPLLSPGAHLVLQTAQSLRHALREAGFAHVVVVREAMSLIAYASAMPFVLNEDAAAARAMYRRYLLARGKLTAVTSDLRFGFAGRGLFEAANDGDMEAADEAWAALLPAAQARFGLDLAGMTALPEGAAEASLAELAQIMPLGLGMILFGRAMALAARDTDRASLLPMLRLAGAAIAALQNALAKRSLTDGLSASIARSIALEILLCRAEAGDGGCVAGLVERGDVPAGWRGFIALVNAGALAAAGALLQALLPEMPDAALPARLRRNALLSLANFVLAPGGETMRVFAYAEALRELGEAADGIVLEAFTRLVNASGYAEAQAAAMAYDVNRLARQKPGGKTAHDAMMALMVLDLAAGDPAEIPNRLDGLEIEPDRRDVLLMEAFIRLVNASRYDEALGFIERYDISALALRHGGEVARNVGLARMVLDLTAGDAADIPLRLAGLEVAPDRRDVLLMEAFIRLVNAARYDEAIVFLRDHDVPAMAARHGGEVARNVGLARAVLDLAVGDPAEIPQRLAGLGLPQARREILLVEAFIRLVNASRLDEAAMLSAAHGVAALARQHAEAVGANAAIALAVMELAIGDAALVARHLAGVAVPEDRRSDLLLGAFTGLINAGRYSEAELLAGAEPCFTRLYELQGDAARDARLACVMLNLHAGRTRTAMECLALLAGEVDEAVLGALRMDAFVRLVNDGDFAAAADMARGHNVERQLSACLPALRQDALAALLLLDLQKMDDGALILRRLEQARKGGLQDERVQRLALATFVTLVNAGYFANARKLLDLVEPVLLKRHPPDDAAARDVLFAAGILFLETREDWRRSANCFARLRDALVKLAPPGSAPDALFWPALRGEVVALHRLSRAEEATALLSAFIVAYPGAPYDLIQQMESMSA